MFVISNEYDRDMLLDFIGSKQGQTGIIWGSKEPGCVIITSGGRGGKRAGYKDEPKKDGSILYIGQGEKGDQDPNKFSNSLLIKGERTILFFSTREPNAQEVRERGNHRKVYKFEGFYQVAAWDFFIPKEGKRANDKLLQFLLVPANNIYNIQSSTVTEPTIDLQKDKPSLEELKGRIEKKDSKPTKGKLSTREYFIRSQEIIDYAIARANTYCERCNKLAPFINTLDIPYLEVHHIFRLADDGPDAAENVAAICPNCHREAHYGKEKDKIREYLAKVILEKEKAIVAK
jgi:5-methylcytosine-specific restriction enzyme A